jgi:signal transduction histidine kinase
MKDDYHLENLRLREVINTAPFPIGVYTGHELKIELANAKMIETYGKGNSVIGKSYAEILPELENQQIFEQLRGVLSTGIPFHAKNQRVDIVIDGILKKHFFNYSFTPLHDANGRIYGVMNTAAEVTDLNEARQQSVDADEKLRLAMDAAELGTYEIDLISGDIITSGNFKRIWDIAGPVTQKAILARLHPEDLHIREKAHQNIDSTGKISYEIRTIHRNGAIRWLNINGKLMTDSTGNKVGLMGIVQDITNRKQSEQQLEELVIARTAELNRSNEDLLQFAHVITHDLKEPVRKIKVFNSMLENKYAENIEESGLEYIRKVKAATDRMATMIDGVLTYSTINAAGYPAEKVDLNQIIENIKTDLELIIQEKKAILVREELPIVEGSPILLHQLFYNLINNALKFSKADVPPRVTITSNLVSVHDVKSVSVSIADNGIGFEEIYTERIFNVFARLHSKDIYDGTGLGLALCRKIVERHNGSLAAAGSPNEGADFIVTLPLLQSSEKL